MFRALLTFTLFFCGVASAQYPLACQVQAAPPTLIRAEGVAENVGDIVLTCSRNGLAVDHLSLVVKLGTPAAYYGGPETLAAVTSELLSPQYGLYEAVLILDEFPAVAGQNVFQGVAGSFLFFRTCRCRQPPPPA